MKAARREKMKAARREKRKKRPETEIDESDRRLDGFECDEGTLECGCLEIFYNLKTFVKVCVINSSYLVCYDICKFDMICISPFYIYRIK